MKTGTGSTQVARAVWTVGRHPTHVLRLPSQGPPRLNVLIIPGNPGVAEYYEPFMHSLHQGLRGRACITCVSQLGMDGQGLTSGVFSLSDQIQHKSDLLRQHFSQEGQPPLALLAHSIGAYMAIKAAAGAADARVRAVVAMYPFLEHDPACPRQRSLAWLSRRWRWVGRLVAPLQLLPHPWLSAVVRVQSGMQEEHALAATRLVLRPDSVRNALFLASTEFAELEGSLPWDDVRRLPSFTAYLAEGDMWCPAWQQQLLEKRLGRTQLRRIPGQTHAFCSYSDQSRDLASSIVADLNGLMEGAADPATMLAAGETKLYVTIPYVKANIDSS
ncbi:hypothetical protein ACKKBG_A26285 [Auxenochlorella protothecoides x Auxenochlorella symbiontica]